MLKTITTFVDSLGSLTYKGLWNAATNTPTLASGVGTTGDYYVVSVPGTTTLDGISSWAAGDWAIFNGSVWEKYNNPADTLGEVLANGNTTAGTDISVTTGDDITFADNSKAIFGAGSDLQIYHDGTHSVIADLGTGDLRLNGVSVEMRSAATGDTYIRANNAGSVDVYHDGDLKLATTATGIDVTGSVTADGLTVEGSSTGTLNVVNFLNTDTSANATANRLGLGISNSSGANYTYIEAKEAGVDAFADMNFYTGVTATKRMTLGVQGDISFYNTAGNSQALFWDASAESLGIGTSSPALAGGGTGLHINATSYPELKFTNSTTGAGAGDGSLLQSSGNNFTIQNREAGSISFSTSNTLRATLDASGNFGLGTNPIAPLHVKGTTNGNLLVRAGSLAVGTLTGTALSSINDAATATVPLTLEGSEFNFVQSNAVKIKVDSSANVGIGVTPSAWAASSNALQVGNYAGLSRNDALGSGDLSYNAYLTTSVSDSWSRIVANASTRIHQRDGSIQFKYGASGASGGAITWSESMRIDASGNLLVGKTADNNAVAGVAFSGDGIVKVTRTDWSLLLNRIGSTSGSLALFQYDGGTVGSISVTASATAYNTSSDQRLKENIADADDAGSKIDAIQVRKFDWKADGSHQDYGMVAQELLEVAPEAVHQPQDPEEMMGVDYSKLVPIMLKEIQSLRARVATLEGNPPQETTTTERVII